MKRKDYSWQGEPHTWNKLKNLLRNLVGRHDPLLLVLRNTPMLASPLLMATHGQLKSPQIQKKYLSTTRFKSTFMPSLSTQDQNSAILDDEDLTYDTNFLVTKIEK